MSGICIFPKSITEAQRNYLQAQEIYRQKRQEISNKIKEEYNTSVETFVQMINDNLRQNMQQTIVSERTGQSVKIETMLNHLYKTVEEMSSMVIGAHITDINNLKTTIKNLQADSINQGKQAQKLAEKEIDKIVQNYANEMQLNNLVSKYLPQFMSGDNIKLSTAQIMGYVKSILKTEINKQLYGKSINDVFSRHPSIILGYIREDATADASLKAIDHLGMLSATAKTVGAEQSKIDIIIPLTQKAASIVNNTELLAPILSALDSANNNMNFEVEGESILETNEFLGIQSKPWKLYLPTTNWNRLSVGSRGVLFKEFNGIYSSGAVDNQYAWHNGVYFLSTRLQDVLGANTVMYVTGESLLWTDELFSQIIGKKYFAFTLDKSHHLTDHVQLADHTDE